MQEYSCDIHSLLCIMLIHFSGLFICLNKQCIVETSCLSEFEGFFSFIIENLKFECYLVRQ